MTYLLSPEEVAELALPGDPPPFPFPPGLAFPPLLALPGLPFLPGLESPLLFRDGLDGSSSPAPLPAIVFLISLLPLPLPFAGDLGDSPLVVILPLPGLAPGESAVVILVPLPGLAPGEFGSSICASVRLDFRSWRLSWAIVCRVPRGDLGDMSPCVIRVPRGELGPPRGDIMV